jgi:hypothetical protein
MSTGFVKLGIQSNGTSQWFFSEDTNYHNISSSPNRTSLSIKPPRETSSCLLEKDSRGYKLISNQNYSSGDIIFIESSLISLPFGSHQNRICWSCLKSGHKQVKVSSQASNIYFCSLNCLQSTDQFLEVCGKLISSLDQTSSSMSSSPSQSTTLLCCIKILYQIIIESDPILFDHLHSHELHSEIRLPDIDLLATHLLTALREHSPSLLNSSSSASPSPYPPIDELIPTILRCLHFNSQLHEIPDLPGTHFHCFYPHLSRINHSCIPNSLLTYHTPSSSSSFTHGTVYSTLVATQTIRVGEEITISYLSQLCSPLQTRREFLKQGFEFHCSCQRCVGEERYFQEHSLTPSYSEKIPKKGSLSEGVWSAVELKDRLSHNRFSSWNRGERFQFLIATNAQITLLQEKLELITSQHLSSHPSSSSSSCSDFSSFVYQAHDLLLLLLDTLLSTMITKKIMTTVTQTVSSSSTSIPTMTDAEEQVTRDVLIIRLVQQLQTCWKLCFDVFDRSVSSSDSTPTSAVFYQTIISHSPTGVNLLLVAGGAASRLVCLLFDVQNSSQFCLPTTFPRSDVSQWIREAREMVREALIGVRLLSLTLDPISRDLYPPLVDRELVCGYKGLLMRIEKLQSVLN